MGRCVVRIKAPLKDPQVIEVKVRRLQVGFLKEARCEGAYFQFSDNVDDPENETTGRYCGHVTGNATRLFLRRGPDLTLTLTSDEQFASAHPVIFSAQFSVLPVRLAIERHRGYSASTSPTCPVECTVRNERRSCRLTSPSYPGVYPRGIRCRIALESHAGRFRIGGQPEDLFDLMNYSDQEGCRMENCEDSYGSGERGGPLVSRDHVEADESIIGDDQSGNGWISAMRRTAETNGQLARLRHHEKKTMQRHEGKQHHKGQLPRRDAGEPRIKSKITRKNHRGVVPSRYFNSDPERSSGTIGSAVPAPEYLGEDRSTADACGAGDYLALLETVDGRVQEISRFCGSGRVPRTYSRGKNVILEFVTRGDGTVTHDGFQVTLHEERVSRQTKRAKCEFAYHSTGRRRNRESIRSPQTWYPPGTSCVYRFLGRITERVSIHIKILRNAAGRPEPGRQNLTLGSCPGNEITVYNGAQVNDSFLIWSYCDASHWDINNIQVPLTSSGNELLIQYYSAKGSHDGQGFTYAIFYRFVKRQRNSTVARRKYKPISLRPVNLSALNLNLTDTYDCDSRIGTFRNWFAILAVFGVVSFVGAVVTIVALTVKCLRIGSSEKTLLQNAKQ
ncbi:hypothetical protein PUN28_002960 [Cardiocondyla obscurior]